ncbi:MAG: ABC transporter substrate-binding protein [Anaerolineae bacterium]|nr:ABC transporter substrate-binding protein [Anaerolineae bacterium]
MIYIGLDDTDVLTSRGTGHLARAIAGVLGADYRLHGVTRHQLLVAPGVPYTKNNSASAILLDANGNVDLAALAARVRAMMLDDYYQGSDPGLCVAVDPPHEIAAYGARVQRAIVSQGEARVLADRHEIALFGLGGDESGVIGALAAVGLAASGDDGRYVLVNRSRELSGVVPVRAVLDVGIDGVQAMDGEPVHEGSVQCDRVRPARRGARPVLVVKREGEHWLPLKLD